MVISTAMIQVVSWAGAPMQQLSKQNSEGENGEKLVKGSDCSSCHAVDRQVVGPAYNEVAKRYAGQPGVVEKLSQKIRAGGSGTWGAVPMTPHPDFTDAQLKQIVT